MNRLLVARNRQCQIRGQSIDLSGVTHIDSSGVATLIEALKTHDNVKPSSGCRD